ncbi:MAG TPA: HlyD family secretion protein [Polyangiaceae bacterium]|nr:HlyD family secretion protein [Polyangiaceae bacterium]
MDTPRVAADSPPEPTRQAAPGTSPASPAKPKSRLPAVLGVLLVVGVAVGAYVFTHRGLESTDDAQVDGEVVPIPSRTGGTITAIHFSENQEVKSGDLLAEIDDKPLAARLAQAEARLQAAEAAAEGADADAVVVRSNATGNKEIAKASLATASDSATTAAAQIREAEAAVTAAEAAKKQSEADLAREKELFAAGASTQGSLDRATTASAVATSNLDAARARLVTLRASASTATSKIAEANAKVEQVSDVDAIVKQAEARARAAHADVETAKAARDLAAIDLSYAKIYAPADGVVSKKTISVGQSVSAGQPIVQLVTHDVWVTANFKETQIGAMRDGQPAEITIDAYPGVELHGALDSFSGATGARFSLLPPDNASGNFTKVVQRVPVRVKLHDVPGSVHLVPGMNVELTIDTKG